MVNSSAIFDDSIEDISEIQAFMKRMEMNEDEGKSFENDFETIIPPTVLHNIQTPISISQKCINDDPKNIPGMVAINVHENIANRTAF